MSTIEENPQSAIVECYTEKGQLRVRVISPGYNSAWKVQFPKHLRVQGTRYLVEEIRPTKNGFYRACGKITLYDRLTEIASPTAQINAEELSAQEVLPPSVDYTKLGNLLAAQKWFEADRETATIMIQVAGQQQRGYLYSDDIQNFSCTELSTINQLWLDFSNHRFGFSIQRQIWLECGGKPGLHQWTSDDYNSYKRFAERIGWSQSGNFFKYHELTGNLNVPVGHLPLYYWVKADKQDNSAYRYGCDIASLVFRLDDCQGSSLLVKN